MNPLTALSKAVTSNAGSVGRQAAAVVAASGLVLAAGLPAHGSSTAEREVQSSSSLSVTAPETAAVSAAATAAVSFEREAVTVAPAPVVVEAPVVEAPVVEAPAAPAAVVRPAVAAPAAPAPAPVRVAAVAAPAPASAAPTAKPEVPSSGIGAALVGSAYSQIGVAQDCTAMVEKALRSVGKSVGDLAPGQFFQYGDVVGTPAAGDLVITGGHVAIYVGNGQVISGGLNGLNTGLHSLSDLPGASFVRVR
ncbi:NlpC/P60 family protein [Arthrobacter crusticola]|uniref:NlpC/P60 family protein n=1 Tax=Arthrobacter crusticola TaxID=2547960 RepID=UPI001FEAA3C6|nr:NlpC/P60 family protein [Arthrobacter crusticola]